MVAACLTRTFSSFSKADLSYYKGMATAGAIFSAGALLGWSAFAAQNLFTWQNGLVALIGAYTFKGKSLSIFSTFQSRVKRLHKEIIDASPEKLQKYSSSYRERCISLGRELDLLPEKERTPYQVCTLAKMRDFFLFQDEQTKQDLIEQLKRLYSKPTLEDLSDARVSIPFYEGVFKIAEIASYLLFGTAYWSLELYFGPSLRRQTYHLNSYTFSFWSGLGLLVPCAFYLNERLKRLRNLQFEALAFDMKYGIILKNDLAFLKALLLNKNHKAFQDCNDVSSFFRRLFPNTSSELPQGWKQLVGSLPKAPALVQFEQEAAVLFPDRTQFATWRDLEIRVNRRRDKSLNTLVKLLKDSNPLFTRAWQLAEEPQCIEVPRSRLALARYWSDSNTIEINQERPAIEKIKSILFETFNAIQSSTFYEIDPRDQNEAALFNEWPEHFSLKGKDTIMNSMGFNIKLLDFEDEYWKMVNRPQPWNGISHAEEYRIEWMMREIFNNPGLLERRLRELS